MTNASGGGKHEHSVRFALTFAEVDAVVNALRGGPTVSNDLAASDRLVRSAAWKMETAKARKVSREAGI